MVVGGIIGFVAGGAFAIPLANGINFAVLVTSVISMMIMAVLLRMVGLYFLSRYGD